MKRLTLLLAGMAIAAATATAQDYGIKTHELKNGMKILVQEDHSIPNVALYIFYRIGSRNERPGTTGLSHFFEHMMFNGAKKYGPKKFDETMEAAGGSNNAYTSNDVTVYQDWFPSTALELIFDSFWPDRRVQGDLFHLWHPSIEDPDDDAQNANMRRYYEKYEPHRRNPARVIRWK